MGDPVSVQCNGGQLTAVIYLVGQRVGGVFLSPQKDHLIKWAGFVFGYKVFCGRNDVFEGIGVMKDA